MIENIVLILLIAAILVLVVLKKNIVQLVILAFFFGAWNIFGKPIYQNMITGQGGTYDVFADAVGLLFVMALGYLLSHMVLRRTHRAEGTVIGT